MFCPVKPSDAGFRALLLSALVMVSAVLSAQTTRNLLSRRVLPGTSRVQLESGYLVLEKSLFFTNLKGEPRLPDYRFNASSGLLIFQNPPADTLWLRYRTLPTEFSKPYFKRPTTLIEPVLPKDPLAYDPNRDGYFKPKEDQLKTDGNISRGITAGNRQDLAVNSSLNLRLGGKLSDGISILGVISDDNNPIQPEGNTQQLQDFDKVFIRLEKDSNALIVGDFEMKRPGSYFMNYYKKSRGLHLDYKTTGSGLRIGQNADLALSRGRFSRNTILGTEGNQGPYRLSGVNGEIFIIIISGTEVVYLDGKQMARGESNDYVINYNTGEITFMPSHMITRFSRIVVEFQYSDRNYQRTVVKTGISVEKGKNRFEVNYFNEQDNKNQNFQQSLDGFDSTSMRSAKEILAQAGDRTQNAVIPNIRAVRPFDTERLLYRKTDSLGYKNVYVFTTNPKVDSVFYEVVFSYVGENKGNYRQKSSTVNGRVFSWVMPLGGIPQGNYEAVELLVAPVRYQMLTAGVSSGYSTGDFYVEGVYTNNNQNTFSRIDKQNDDGFGLAAGINDRRQLKSTRGELTWTNKVKTELVSGHFKYLERYRPVEFERSWNRQLSVPVVTNLNLPEVIAGYETQLRKGDQWDLFWKTGLYRRSATVNGFQNLVGGGVSIRKWRLKASAEQMQNSLFQDTLLLTNRFQNADAELNRTFRAGTLGGGYHREQSRFSSGSDSLRAGTYGYESARLFFEGGIQNFTYGLNAERRTDELPYMGRFRRSTRADEMRWQGGYTGKRGVRLNANGSYRYLQFLDSMVLKGNPERNALGRIESEIPLFKKSLRLNTFYQVGTGQEQKREFTYIKVADGNGVYIWKDYDSNEVQSLNEFELASDYDRKRANYIRTFIPVQGFIKSRNVQFNQTLNLAAPAAWSRKKGARYVLSRFSVLLVYRTDRRTTSDLADVYLNPFLTGVNDPQLLNSSSSLRGTLYINRNHPSWSADLNRINSRTKALLVNGAETRQTDESTLNTRVNFSRNLGTVVQLIYGNRSYYSQILTQRNYAYDFYSAEPQLQFTALTNNLGAALIGKYYRAVTDTIFSRNLEAGLEIRISKAGKGSFSGNFRLVGIDFNGDPVSPLGYEFMKGLLPGTNYTWNLVYQQRLSGNIQMDVSYEGRKSERSPFIHIGRIMARYLF